MSAMQIDADLEHLSHDPALTAKIMRKREDEMKRRAKLLNPRTRQHGANHAVLDSQLAEKRAGETVTREEEAFHAKAAVLQEEVAQAFENMKAAGTRERHKAATEFSLTHLRKEDRREYFLNDPNELKNDLVRTHAELNQLGPSSMQTLGEDVEAKASEIKEAKRATNRWLKDQMEEKEAREAAEMDRERTYDREILFANEIRGVCEQASLQEAKEDRYEAMMENKQIADQHRQRRNAQQERNLLANERHTGSIVHSDRMKEAIDHVYGSNGNLLRTEYKRTSYEEAMEMHATNAYLVLQKKLQAEAEKHEEYEHAGTIGSSVQILGHVEEMKRQATLQRRLAAEEYNRTAAAEKRQTALMSGD